MIVRYIFYTPYGIPRRTDNDGDLFVYMIHLKWLVMLFGSSNACSVRLLRVCLFKILVFLYDFAFDFNFLLWILSIRLSSVGPIRTWITHVYLFGGSKHRIWKIIVNLKKNVWTFKKKTSKFYVRLCSRDYCTKSWSIMFYLCCWHFLKIGQTFFITSI